MKHTHSSNNAGGFLRIFLCISLAAIVGLIFWACDMTLLQLEPRCVGKVTAVRLTGGGLTPGKKATFSFTLLSALSEAETLTMTNIHRTPGYPVGYPDSEPGVIGASSQVAKIADLINGSAGRNMNYTASATGTKLTFTAKTTGTKTMPTIECSSAQNYSLVTMRSGSASAVGIYRVDISEYTLSAGHVYSDAYMLGTPYQYNPLENTAEDQAAAIAALVNAIEDARLQAEQDRVDADNNYVPPTTFTGYTAATAGSVITFTANGPGEQLLDLGGGYIFDSRPSPKRTSSPSGKISVPFFTQGTADQKTFNQYQFTFKEALHGEKLVVTNIVIGTGAPGSTNIEYIPSVTETTPAQQALAFVTLVNSKANRFFDASVPANGTTVTLQAKRDAELPVRTIEKL